MPFSLNSCDAEYNKDSNLRKEDVHQIREWVERQLHLPQISEYNIIQFYTASNYSPLKTKELIDGHYKFRHEAPELFVGLDMAKEQLGYEFFDIWHYCIFPKTNESRDTIYISLRDFDASKYTWKSFASMLIKATFATILSEGSNKGYYWIVDGEGCTLAHLLSSKLTLTRHLVRYVQFYIPMKIEKIFCIRMNSVAEKVYLLMKQFFSEEMDQKISLLPQLEEIYEFIPKKSIPRDLGGLLPQTREELSENERIRVSILNNVVMEELSRKSDESKRVRNNTDDKSSAASFKQLEID